MHLIKSRMLTGALALLAGGAALALPSDPEAKLGEWPGRIPIRVKHLQPGADFTGALFMEQDMEGADFRKTTVTRVNFGLANLTGARFDGVDCRTAILDFTTLNGAVFDDATLFRHDAPHFLPADISKAHWAGKAPATGDGAGVPAAPEDVEMSPESAASPLPISNLGSKPGWNEGPASRTRLASAGQGQKRKREVFEPLRSQANAEPPRPVKRPRPMPKGIAASRPAQGRPSPVVPADPFGRYSSKAPETSAGLVKLFKHHKNQPEINRLWQRGRELADQDGTASQKVRDELRRIRDRLQGEFEVEDVSALRRDAKGQSQSGPGARNIQNLEDRRRVIKPLISGNNKTRDQRFFILFEKDKGGLNGQTSVPNIKEYENLISEKAAELGDDHETVQLMQGDLRNIKSRQASAARQREDHRKTHSAKGPDAPSGMAIELDQDPPPTVSALWQDAALREAWITALIGEYPTRPHPTASNKKVVLDETGLQVALDKLEQDGTDPNRLASTRGYLKMRLDKRERDKKSSMRSGYGRDGGT
jgi:hypothetical protein